MHGLNTGHEIVASHIAMNAASVINKP